MPRRTEREISKKKAMEYYRGNLCVTYEELTSGDSPVISFETLRKNITRKNIVRARQGGGEGHCALIVYSSLPLKYKERFEERYGDPVEQMKGNDMQRQLKTDGAAREWYAAFRYEMNGTRVPLSEDKIEEYTLNASVLNVLQRSLNEKQMLGRALNNRRSDVWAIVYEESEQLCRQYGHTLPQSLARLKVKLSQYRRDGYAALLSGKLGNANTQKITAEGGKYLVALKCSRVPVLTDVQILERYNQEAPRRGWKPLKSLRALTMWLEEPEVKQLWYGAVHGELASVQLFNRKHRTELPTRRDSLWYGDGTKLNLYYRDEDGRVRTVQVYEVMDAATEVLLGYHISETEDYEAQYHAYRMAIQVSGHKPYEIVHDNQGGHKRANSSGMLDRICHIHRTTAPYNGESKTIESAFGRFQMQVLHKDWRFTGQNVTAKKTGSRPNMEFIEANKDSLYTLDELKEAYLKARTEWNESLRPGQEVSRWAMYQSSVNEDTPEVTAADMVDMFWVRTSQEITFTSGGLELTVKGRKMTYEVYGEPGVPDHEWRRRNTLRRFVVEYDPYDLTSVRLLRRDKAGELRFERVARPYMVIHRALQDQQEGEMAFIRQEQEAALRDRIERHVAARAVEYEHGVAPEQHGLNTPRLKGVTREVQDEIDRRMRKYSREPEEWQVGRRTKQLSLTDWRDVEDGNREERLRRANGKL